MKTNQIYEEKSMNSNISGNKDKSSQSQFIVNENKKIISGNLRIVNSGKSSYSKIPDIKSVYSKNPKSVYSKLDNEIKSKKELDMNFKNQANQNINEKNKIKNPNQELINKFYRDIYADQKDQQEDSLNEYNRYTYNVLENNKFSDVVKILKDDNMPQHKKTELYFKLKAEKYNDEVESCTKIPLKLHDMLDISEDAKKKYMHYKNRLKLIDSILCLTAIIAIYIAFYDNNIMVTSYNLLFDKYIVDERNDILRYLNIFLNSISLILIFCRYNLLVNMKRLNFGTLANFDTIYSSGFLSNLFAEMFINMILIPPKTSTFFEMGGSIFVSYNYSSIIPNSLPKIKFLDYKSDNTTYAYLVGRNITNPGDYFYVPKTSVKLQYNISTLIVFLMSFRIYHFFRLVHTFSSYNNPKSSIISKYLNCSVDVSFGIRAILKENPALFLIFGMVFIIVFFGTGLSIFEYYNQAQMTCLDISGSSTNSSQAQVMLYFSNIYNSFWLVIVTMTTIGYGDIFPTTLLGRLLAMSACICGTFLLSLIVVFLNNYIFFDEIEKKIFDSIVEESYNPTYLRENSSNLIKRILSYSHLKKVDPKGSAMLRLSLRLEIKFLLNEFRLVLFQKRQREFDVDGEIGNIDFNITNGLVPIKKNYEQIIEKSKTFEKAAPLNFMCSNHSDDFKKKSLQMYNLLKVLNKNEALENLNSIDEVYSNQVDMIDEIVYYNRIKLKNKNNMPNKIKIDQGDNKSIFIRLSKANNSLAGDVKKNGSSNYKTQQTVSSEDEDENLDHKEYINQLRKNVLF